MTLPRLAFLVTGCPGGTYAICFAELGYEVLGGDVDEAKIAMLADGRVPFHEPGLDDPLRRNPAAGRLRFSTSYQQAAGFADVHSAGPAGGPPPRHRRPELSGSRAVGGCRLALSGDGPTARLIRSAAFRCRFHRSSPS